MRTVHSSSCLSQGGLPQCMLGYQSPRNQAPPIPLPWTKHPPVTRHIPAGPGTPPSPTAGTPQDQAHPLGPGTPRSRHPPGPGTLPPEQAPPPRDQAPLPPGLGTLPRGQTHTSKNITFATSLRTVISHKRLVYLGVCM